jgi:hypothetical protein
MGTRLDAHTGNEGSVREPQECFLTQEQTAALLTVSKRSLQKMMRDGLPFYEPVPGRRVFRRDEVLSWLTTNKRRIRGDRGSVQSSGGNS